MSPVDFDARAARIERTVEPLAALPRWILAVPFLPVAFVVVAYTAGYVATRGQDPGFHPQAPYLLMGVAWIALLGWASLRWDRETWRAAAVVRRPSCREVGAAVVAAAVAVVVLWPAVNALAAALGVPPREPPTIETPVGLAMVVFGTVVVAPVAEEVFFRGVAFGYIAGRGHGVGAAALGSLVLFGLIHPGVAGVLVALAFGALLTALRVWYDDLVGAMIAHALINAVALLISLSVLPSPY